MSHLAHAVPFVPVVQPALQVQVPSEPHTPLRQSHVDGAFLMIGSRHRPEPVIPSSQVAQSAGHAWQVEPKNPGAQVSQDVPLNPGGQVHVPEAEHTPAPAHGGEHAEDWMSSSWESPDAPEGSCEASGTLSQKTRRSLEEPETAIHTFDEIASAPGEIFEVVFEGVLGSWAKVACPE